MLPATLPSRWPTPSHRATAIRTRAAETPAPPWPAVRTRRRPTSGRREPARMFVGQLKEGGLSVASVDPSLRMHVRRRPARKSFAGRKVGCLAATVRRGSPIGPADEPAAEALGTGMPAHGALPALTSPRKGRGRGSRSRIAAHEAARRRQRAAVDRGLQTERIDDAGVAQVGLAETLRAGQLVKAKAQVVAAALHERIAVRLHVSRGEPYSRVHRMPASRPTMSSRSWTIARTRHA
jgi:hypothetical protein